IPPCRGDWGEPNLTTVLLQREHEHDARFINQTNLPVGTSMRQIPLFHSDLKGDTGGIVGEVDSECVGGSRRQIGGRHVEYSLATAIQEASVRNGVDSNFVDGVDRITHCAHTGYRSTPVWPIDLSRIGNEFAVALD